MQEAPGSSPGATTVVRRARPLARREATCTIREARGGCSLGGEDIRMVRIAPPHERPGMSFEGLRAAIFDVDGVLVASPHERAWREALAEVATTHWGSGSSGTFAPERFTSAVYQEHVAGKARMSGARAVLDYFRVPDAEQRAAEYARHKQRRLELLLEAG